MRIVFAGNNERGIACLKALSSSNYDIRAVLAHPKIKEGNGYFRSVSQEAERAGIPCIQPDNINDYETCEILRSLEPDILVLVGYSQYVGREVRSIPAFGALNIHASPLPYYRGAAPLNWMLINGERTGAVSIIEIDNGIDTGPIIAQEEFEILPADTIRTLCGKVNSIAPRLLLNTLDSLQAGSIQRRVQNPSEGSYYTKRHPKDGEISFEKMFSEEIHNLVRALSSPYPGAFFYFNGEKIIVERTAIPEKKYHGIKGRIAAIDRDGFIVIARDSGILIKSIRDNHGEIVNAKTLNVTTGLDLA